MSKATIFVVLIALVAIASANEDNEVKPSRWKDAALKFQAKVDKIIDSSLTRVARVVEKAKKRVDKLGESLKNATEKFGQKVYEKINKLLQRAEDKLTQLTNDATAGVDVSACKKLSSELRYSALAAVSNMSTCIVDKLEQGGGYIEAISKISSDVLINITLIREDSHHCSDNVTGIKSAAKAIVCSNVAAARATWVTVKSVPKVTANIAKLTFHLATLPVTLPYCAATHGYNALRHESSDIVKRVRKCVAEKRQQSGDEDTQAPPAEVESPEEEFDTPDLDFDDSASTPHYDPAAEAAEVITAEAVAEAVAE